MNFVDFLAILPYVVSSLIESMQDLQILGKAGKIMRLVRVMRILRIFKLVRHFAGLQSLIYTLKQVGLIWFVTRVVQQALTKKIQLFWMIFDRSLSTFNPLSNKYYTSIFGMKSCLPTRVTLQVGVKLSLYSDVMSATADL